MQTNEGTDTFYNNDRERIKCRSILPTETLCYIEALETVAKAAAAFWGVAGTGSAKEIQAKKREELYDALSVVNFMDETL